MALEMMDPRWSLEGEKRDGVHKIGLTIFQHIKNRIAEAGRFVFPLFNKASFFSQARKIGSQKREEIFAHFLLQTFVRLNGANLFELFFTIKFSSTNTTRGCNTLAGN